MRPDLTFTLIAAGLIGAAAFSFPASIPRANAGKPLRQSAADPKAASAKVDDIDFSFFNGSNLRLRLRLEDFEVQTRYGKLTIPAHDIREVEFGLRYPEGAEQSIRKAIAALGAGNSTERTSASKTLVELGPHSYSLVFEACDSRDPEVARRAKDVLQTLRKTFPKSDLKTSMEDQILTPGFVVVGRVLTTSLDAKSELFGDLKVPVDKIRTMKIVTPVTAGLEIRVDAAVFANAGSWMETPFSFDGRSNVVLTASGQVDTWPQSPGSYMSGPNGSSGAAQPGQRVPAAIGRTYASTLIGKIGSEGDPFVIGERMELASGREGKLYLHIGPSQWNCNSTGGYDVRVSRR